MNQVVEADSSGDFATFLETRVEEDVGETNGNGKWQPILLSIAGAVLIIMGGYFVTVLNQLQATMTSIDKRVVAIESNGFTTADALRMQEQLAEITRSMAALPPPEYRNRQRAVELFLAREHGYEPPED